jgi:hypothetical protein
MLPLMLVLAASPIDTAFQRWAEKLPDPKSLSDMNGAGFSCKHHGGGTTLNHLVSLSKTLKLERDADLLQLVPWARHRDECLRYIALEAIMARIGFDQNTLSVPNLEDPEHFQFHDIMVALTAYLDARKISWDPKSFDGLLIKTTLADFPSLAHGKWRERLSPQKGFQTFLELDAKTIAVTSRHLPKDPKWPDHTWTSAVKSVTRDARGVFVITCEWSQESNASGYQGEKNVPAQFTYSIWPVAPGLAWFKEGEQYWIQLER